jgi:hypothetical protein
MIFRIVRRPNSFSLEPRTIGCWGALLSAASFDWADLEPGGGSCERALGAREPVTLTTSRVPIVNLNEDQNLFLREQKSFMQFVSARLRPIRLDCAAFQRFENKVVIYALAKNKQKAEKQIPNSEQDIFKGPIRKACGSNGLAVALPGRQGTRALSNLLYHLCL